jgi:hypothetical protein
VLWFIFIDFLNCDLVTDLIEPCSIGMLRGESCGLLGEAVDRNVFGTSSERLWNRGARAERYCNPFLAPFTFEKLAEPPVFRRKPENFSITIYWKAIRGSIPQIMFCKLITPTERSLPAFRLGPLSHIPSYPPPTPDPKSIPGSPTPPFRNILSSKNQDMSAPAENDSHSAAMKAWPSIALGGSAALKFSRNVGEFRDKGTGTTSYLT